MDFSKIDWAHALGQGVMYGVGGAALLALAPAAPIVAALGALGVGVTATGIGMAASASNVVGQAKATAAK